MATAGYLVHQENVLSQAIDNVKDLRDALALERRANAGEVAKGTRDIWRVLLANAIARPNLTHGDNVGWHQLSFLKTTCISRTVAYPAHAVQRTPAPDYY